METIILSGEPLPETASTVTLDFFDPKDSGTRGTGSPEIKGREGKITFDPKGYRIFSLPPASVPSSALPMPHERADQDFYVICIPFTLHKVPGASYYYEEITFQIEIEDRKTRPFDLFPRYIASTVSGELDATVSADFTIIPIEKSELPRGRRFRFTGLHPTITAFGKEESFFYWVYKTSSEPKGVVPGTKHALFVLRAPHGTPSVVATVSGETRIAKPLFGKWNFERKETELHEVRWDLTKAVPFYEPDISQTPTKDEQTALKSPTPGDTYDVCIVCALADEGLAFIEATKQRLGVQFEKTFDPQLKMEYYHTRIPNARGELLKLQVSWPAKYGPVEMALHLKPVLATFRPRFAGMTGICAGDKKRVKLGDLIIANQAYTYDSGKIFRGPSGEADQKFDSGFHPARPEISRFLQTFEYARFLQTLEPWKLLINQHNPILHVGTMASGSAVRADDLFEEMRFPVRDTLAIDMEGAAFYRTAMEFPGMYALLAKGVSDFADSNKNDFYRQYASALSAMYMLAFVQEYVTSEHMP